MQIFQGQRTRVGNKKRTAYYKMSIKKVIYELKQGPPYTGFKSVKSMQSYCRPHRSTAKRTSHNNTKEKQRPAPAHAL